MPTKLMSVLKTGTHDRWSIWLLLVGLLLIPVSAGAIPDEVLLAEAETTIHQLAPPAVQTRLLGAVAVAYAKVDAAKAERVLAAAANAAETAADPMERVLARCELALAVEKWQPDKAQQWLVEATHEARSLTAPVQQALALRKVADGVRQVKPATAPQLCTEAAVAARAITASLLRVAALRDLAVVIAAVDPLQAEDLLTEASQILHRQAAPDTAVDLARAELAIAWATVDPEAAISETKRLSNPETRTYCRQRLCTVLAVHNPDTALQVVDLEPAVTDRALARAMLAAALPEAHNELAGLLVGAALAVADEANSEEAAPIRAAAALALAKSNPEMAIRLMQTLPDDDLRMTTTVELAPRLARSRPVEALALAETLEDWLERERCLGQLLPHLGVEYRGEAVRLARELRNARLRAEVLLALATGDARVLSDGHEFD